MSKITALEKRMIQEAAIREYKLKHEKNKKPYYNDLSRILRKLAPINILLGVVASIGLIIYKGWEVFFQLVLTGVIWITIISTALAALSKKD